MRTRRGADTLRSLKYRIEKEMEFLEEKQKKRERVTMTSHIAAWNGFKLRIERMIKIN